VKRPAPPRDSDPVVTSGYIQSLCRTLGPDGFLQGGLANRLEIAPQFPGSNGELCIKRNRVLRHAACLS
jgi:hypothetical protein